MKKKGAWWLTVSVLVVLVALLPWTMAAQELPLPEAGVPSLQQGTGPNFCIPTSGQITQWFATHKALDIAGGQAAGVTPVYAAHGGLVVYVGPAHAKCNYNYAVAIRYDGQIKGKYVLTLYNHMGHWDPGTGFVSYVDPEVSVGREVKKGQTIGYQGDAPTGVCKTGTTGVHGHFAVYEHDDQPFLEQYTSWGTVCNQRSDLYYETGGTDPCPLKGAAQAADPELLQYLGSLPTDSENWVEETCSQYYKDTTAQQTATILVMDISGSMGDSCQGGVKIESAKEAALDIINMIEQESQVGDVEHHVALATFSTDAWLDLPLTTDYHQARETINSLHATNRTNIGAGLETANRALQQATSDSKKVVILLSDGKTNEGLSPDGILSGPVQDAVNANICIYTIGFGDPGDLDEDLLRNIADATGCGKYYYASSPFDLRKEYAVSRHDSLGTLIADFSGQVGQGETQQVGQIEVSPSQGELYVSLIWPGSQLDLILTDPQGQTVDANYPGATIAAYTRLVYLIVTNPLPGLWQISVMGRDVPEGTTDYAILTSVRETVTPSPPLLPEPEDGSAMAIALTMVIAITAVVAGFYTLSRRGGLPRPATAGAGVRVVGGAVPLKSKGFRRGMLHIGRDPRNELVLADDKVSRRHARVVRTQDGYLLEDLDSQNGTYVNGERVTRKRLRHGDEIRVGDTRLIFQRHR